MRCPFLLLFSPLVVVCACSSATPATADPAPCTAPGTETRPTEPPPKNDPPAAPTACDTNTVPLEITFAKGIVDGQLVPAKSGGTDGWLAIDTGSAHTFLYGTAPKEKPVTIGCETFSVDSYDFSDDPYDGKPILGVLGADFFTTRSVDFDYPGRKIVRHKQGVPPNTAPDTAGYAIVPYENLGGHIGLRATVDGQQHLLMVDTGSPHVLLVPFEGRPTDEKTQLSDASGALVDAYFGASVVTFDNETRTVPAYRVPKWPYFEGYQKELHAELHGLFGRSSIGYRRIVIDVEAKELRLGPIQKTP
jgi:hypothetical protein